MDMKKIMMLGLGLALGLACTTFAKGEPKLALSEDYAAYRGMTYGEFRREHGSEAVWMNFFASSARIPNTNVYAVFERANQQGELADSDSLYRLSGSVWAFFPDLRQNMTPKELAGQLAWGGSGAATPLWEIKEGPPTMYYIADKYAEIRFDEDGDGELDAQATVALYEDGSFSPDSDTWLFFLDE